MEIEDRHYPGRYDTYYTDSYVEWLKANVEKLTSTEQQLKDSISLLDDLRTCINCSDAQHADAWIKQVDGIKAKLESI